MKSKRTNSRTILTAALDKCVRALKHARRELKNGAGYWQDGDTIKTIDTALKAAKKARV